MITGVEPISEIGDLVTGATAATVRYPQFAPVRGLRSGWLGESDQLLMRGGGVGGV